MYPGSQPGPCRRRCWLRRSDDLVVCHGGAVGRIVAEDVSLEAVERDDRVGLRVLAEVHEIRAEIVADCVLSRDMDRVSDDPQPMNADRCVDCVVDVEGDAVVPGDDVLDDVDVVRGLDEVAVSVARTAACEIADDGVLIVMPSAGGQLPLLLVESPIVGCEPLWCRCCSRRRRP